MSFEMHGSTYEMAVEFYPETGEYVIAHPMDGEITNVGRGKSIPRAVGALYRQMHRDIEEEMIER